MNDFLNRLRSNPLWSNDEGQDVAEYAVMLAVILVIVVSTVRLIGSNAGNVFSQVGSAIQ
jgi:Flp pilus assembly pilin Flp